MATQEVRMTERDARTMYREEGQEFGYEGGDLRKYVGEMMETWQLREDQWRDKEFQLRQAQICSESGSSSNSRKVEIKLRKLEKDEDVDSYLQAFEHIATHNQWEQCDWAVALQQGLVNSKAMVLFSQFSSDDLKDYQMVKTEILKFYSLTAEEYKKKVMVARQEKNET